MRLFSIAALSLALLLPTLAAADDWPALTLPAQQLFIEWNQAPVERATPTDDTVDAEELRATLAVLHTRRQMLTAHQVLGGMSAALIIAAASVGTINRIALETGNIRRSEMEPLLGLHRGLAGAAIGTYWSAGVLAWTMPSPSGRRADKGISRSKSTRDKHIALSIAHNIAMGLVTVTGVLQANVLRPKDWQPLMVTHTVAAVASAGFVLGAAVVIGRL